MPVDEAFATVRRGIARDPSVTPAGGPRVILTTHLLPVARGIFATLNVTLKAPVSSADLTARFAADYADDPTVRVLPTPEDVSLRKIVGTNECHVGIASADNVAVITAMAHVVVTEGLVATSYVAERCETKSFNDWCDFVAKPENSPEAFEATTGVPAAGRTIVFDVSGYTTISSTLRVTANKITVAGQTAPGDGFGLKNETFRVSGSNNVYRFFRFRDGRSGDAIDIDSTATNTIFDHCDAIFAHDENFSSFNTPPDPATTGRKTFSSRKPAAMPAASWSRKALMSSSKAAPLSPENPPGRGRCWTLVRRAAPRPSFLVPKSPPSPACCCAIPPRRHS